MYYLFAIASLLIYILAPMEYSWGYCCLCSVVYILNAIIGLLPSIKKGLISFELIFTVALFLCSYLFPLVVYQVDSAYSLFSFGYNHQVITKCTALVNVAYSFYWLGAYVSRNKYYKNFIADRVFIDNHTINVTANIVLFLFIICVALGGLEYYTDRYVGGNMSTNTSFSYVNLIFSTFAVLLSCSLYFASTKKTFLKATIILLAICVIILFTGSRTLPMYVLLPLLFCFQKKYDISAAKMGVGLLALMAIFIIIGQVRHSVITLDSIASFQSSQSSIGVYDNFIDFIVNNRNLYDIYESVEQDGYLYGKNFLSSILSVIPFSQGIISNVFNIPYWQMDSAYFCTYKVLGNNPSLGLGTHVVGDVYLAAGVPGVIILFYLLGVFVTKIKNGAEMRNNAFLYVTYAFMVSYAVFMCRGSFFGPVRGILWSALILAVMNSFRRRSY
jgi:oligosaccharide repeat unit polymerase